MRRFLTLLEGDAPDGLQQWHARFQAETHATNQHRGFKLIYEDEYPGL